MGSGEPVRFSPDRSRFFFVTRFGNLECDCNIFELHVFDVAKVREEIEHNHGTVLGRHHQFRLASRISSNSFAGISGARWIDSHSTIAFLGAPEDLAPQIHTFDVDSQKARVLTDAPLGVLSFDMTVDSIVYRAIVEKRPKTKLVGKARVYVDDFDLSAAFGSSDEYVQHMFVMHGGGRALDMGRVNPEEAWQPYWISPNGRWAVGIRAVDDVNAARFTEKYSSSADASQPGAFHDVYQFVLIDIPAGTLRPIVDAPTGAIVENWSTPNALWAPDSSYVVLANTMLPTSSRKAETQAGPWVVEFDPSTSSLSVVTSLPSAPIRAETMRWSDPGIISIALRGAGESRASISSSALLATRSHEGWLTAERANYAGEDARNRVDSFSVRIEEAANSTPVAVAKADQQTIRLMPTDPILHGLRIAPVIPIHWVGTHQRRWVGGLMLPACNRTGKTVPLVLQPYLFEPDRFLPDGFTTTAFAAQALAARGIAVLQMRIQDADAFTPNEGENFMNGIDSAVEFVRTNYPVDGTLVGIVGFSHSAALVSYAITHPARTRFAAAVVADAGDPSYFTYLMYAVSSRGASAALPQFERFNGAEVPFWRNKQGWLRQAPGFNLDRVDAAVLLTVNGSSNASSGLELYAGLRILNKPVEYIVFPEGAHQLRLPSERLDSMETTVDWMAFWLQGARQGEIEQSRYERWSKWSRNRAKK